MKISGTEFLFNTLNLVAESVRTVRTDKELEVISDHSVVVLDNLNLVPETAVGGIVREDIPGVDDSGAPRFTWNSEGSFTWGPSGNVNKLVPVEIQWWSVVNTDGQEYSRGGYSTSPAPAIKNTSGIPDTLYWSKTINEENQFTFTFRPVPSPDTKIAFYARVPKVDRILPATEYVLDPGRGEYLMLMLAIAVAPIFGYPVPPSVYTRAQAAEARLADDSATARDQYPATPGWMIGTGRRRRR